MEKKPHSPVDTIRLRLAARQYPVILGKVDGSYSLDALHTFEASIRELPEVTTVTLGRTAEHLIYVVDTRLPTN